jgi:hypothetical protein
LQIEGLKIIFFLGKHKSACVKSSRFVLIHSAFIATIFDLVPYFFPLFSPRKRSATTYANFFGQMLLSDFVHSIQVVKIFWIQILFGLKVQGGQRFEVSNIKTLNFSNLFP